MTRLTAEPPACAGHQSCAAGALLRLVGDSYSWLLIGQIVAAVAQPLVLNAVTGITGRYLAEKDRPTGIAVGTASVFAGIMLAFLLSAVLPDSDQMRTMLAVTAEFAVLAAAVLLVALRNPGEHKIEHHRPDRGALHLAWGVPLIRRLCLLAVFPFGVFVAMTTFAQALLEPAGVSGGTTSTILLANVVAGVIGNAVLPILVVRHRSEVALLVGSMALTALVAVGLLVDHPLPAFLVMAVVALIAVPVARWLGQPIAELLAVPTSD